MELPGSTGDIQDVDLAQSGESQDQPPTQLTIPPDDTEVTLSDGATVTYGELKQGYTRMQDYTVKTQEAAEIRRQADEAMASAQALRADAEGDKLAAARIREAVDQDVSWYRAHPDVSQWESYQPEVNKVLGGDSGYTQPAQSAPAPQPSPALEQPSEMNGRVEQLERAEQERAVDLTLASVRQVARSEGNELVTQKLLLSYVKNHQASNEGTLPTHTQIESMAKEIQTDLVDQGIPVPKGEIPPSGSTKPSLNADSSVQLNPAWKGLNMKKDRGKVEDALSGLMADLASRR